MTPEEKARIKIDQWFADAECLFAHANDICVV